MRGRQNRELRIINYELRMGRFFTPLRSVQNDRNNGGASPALQLPKACRDWRGFGRADFVDLWVFWGGKLLTFWAVGGILLSIKTGLRAYNKMTLYSSGLFFVLTASGCIDNASALPVSPSLQDKKTLAFCATVHFVRDSKDGKKSYEKEEIQEGRREGVEGTRGRDGC
jgi:hypothetical protein